MNTVWALPAIDTIAEPMLRQSILAAIAVPDVALLLVVLGALAISTEFCKPGRVIPGVLGALALQCGLVGLWALPAGWWSVAFLGAAVVCLGLAMLYRSRVPAIVGAAFILSGALSLRVHTGPAMAAAIAFLGIGGFLLPVAARARLNKIQG